LYTARKRFFGHPEVIDNVSLVTPLYAGTPFFFSRTNGQSAGNCNFLVFSPYKIIGTKNYLTTGSSETLRGDIMKKLQHIKHRKPITNYDFGQYLAGLYEGDGYAGPNGIIICFHEKDNQSAECLCKFFKFGIVKKVKGKRAIIWRINTNGLIKFYSLINGFLRTQYKLDQIYKNASKYLPQNFQTIPDTSSLLNSWWLTGFTDADGSLYVQILEHKKNEIRIQLKFSLKDPTILYQLKTTFGSFVGKRIHPNQSVSYYWSSTSHKNAFKVFRYFHHYSLQSGKWLEFMYWRKILRLVYEKNHKTEHGLFLIKKYKTLMEKLRS
jgi:hypothetical protein